VFSVVMPTYDRAATLKKILGAWERQVPDDLHFEVVVVDDGSRDETSSVLAGLQPSRYSLVRLRQENQGPAVARNYGLAASTGEWILFTGDDIEPAPDLLDRHLSEHRKLADNRTAVLGKIEWPPDLDLTSTMLHVDGVGAQQFSYRHMRDGDEYDFRHFYTSNVSVARELLEREPEGFSTDFSAAAYEDAEYSYRLCRHGMKIVYREAARAWHHHPYTARSFFHRQTTCGQMAAVLVRKWPGTGSLVGVDELLRRRRRDLFSFPGRRRRVAEIGSNLDVREALAVEVATVFDYPITSAVDPFLLRLFQHAYLKGLAAAMAPEAAARKMAASWFLDLMGEAAIVLRAKLDPGRLALVDRRLSEMIGTNR